MPALQAVDPQFAAEPLSTLGACIMGLSVGTVLLVLGYCLTKVLTLPPVEVEENRAAPPP